MTERRIFVTGGTGFLGRALLPALVAEGWHVRALTRHPDQAPWLCDLPVEVVEGDVENEAVVERAVQGCDYVIHAAGRFRFWGARETFEQTNVHGAENVLRAAAQANVAKFIHISTLAVVGTPLADRLLDETHPTYPVDPYQRSKLVGERLALRYQRERDLPVVILRPGAFYGPYGRYAFNRLFIEDPLRGLLIKVDGGKNIIFPVYTGDVAAGAIRAIAAGRAGEVYNICGESLTHNQVNAIVSEEAGISRFRLNTPGLGLILLAYLWTALSEYTHVEPFYPLNLRSYVFNSWRVSIAKAERELGFTPISFREGVRRTLAWYEEAGIWRRKKAH